jgi:hypothetical protein
MAQIGSFTRSEDGTLNGTIKTLTLDLKARFVPADANTNDKAPALRLLAGSIEIGAACAGPPRTTPPIMRSSSTTRPSRRPSTPTLSTATAASPSSGHDDPTAAASRKKRGVAARPSLCKARRPQNRQIPGLRQPALRITNDSA